MKYLLDTSVIVEHLRGKRSLEISFLEKGSAISVITQAELFYGAYKSTQPERNLKKIKEMLEDLRIEVVLLNEDVLDKYGKIKVQLEKKGRRLDEFDLLIAATALSLNLTLVTRNIRHFQRLSQLKLKSRTKNLTI